MKILYVLDFLPPYVKREIEALADHGHDITVLLPEKSSSGTAGLWNRITEIPSNGNITTYTTIPLRLLNGKLSELAAPACRALKHPGIIFSSLPGEFRYALAAGEAAASLPGSYRPDVIHAHFALDAAHIAGKLSRILKAPFTVTTHATDIFVPRRRDRLESVLGRAAAVLTISNFNRKYLAEEKIFKGEVTLCKLGIPLNALPERQRTAERTGGVCVASGLVPKKGVEVLLEALKLCTGQIPGLSVTVIGSDPEGTLLEHFENSSENLPVTFTGALSSHETIKAIASAGFFILPCVRAPNGDMDGIPVALMEAMGMGIPCISTAISGIPELIEHGVSGLLAEPGSPESLAEMTEILLADPDISERMAAYGRKKAMEEHDPAKQVEILINVFRKVRKT